MIDPREIKQPIRTRIEDSLIIPADSIQWDGKILDPSGLEIWMSENYLPITEGFATNQCDFVSGILSYAINVPIGKGEQSAVEAGVAIGSLFSTLEIINTTNYGISIQSTKCSYQGPLETESRWYSYIIDIEFRAYE
jgi:hypothetical protein